MKINPLKIVLAILFVACFFVLPKPASAATNVYYSVGQNTTDHKTGSPTVTISGGVATFSVPQTAHNLGVGDKVTYNTNVTAYISAKITQSKWRLVTATGGTPADIVGSTVVSIAHAYASLSLAEAGIPTPLGTSDLTDATGGNFVLNIPLYYDTGPDTTAVTISGWTTSATNYIRVYTPTNTSTEVNQSQRHSGKWDNKKYRLQITNDTDSLQIAESYTIVDGLQVKSTTFSSNYKYGISLYDTPTGVTGVRVSNNIVVAGNATRDYSVGIAFNANSIAPNYVWNNIVYGFSGTGGRAIGVSADYGTPPNYVYNNTAANSTTCFYTEYGDAKARNNIAFNCTDAFTGSFVSGSNYNAANTNDNTVGEVNPSAPNDRVSQTFKFVNEAQKDFHLLSTDSGARGFGGNLSPGNDSNLTFTTDVDGQSRPLATTTARWDIGADQTQAKNTVISRPPASALSYGAATPVFYSVGQNTTDHKTGSPTVTISGGVATFSVPQTARNLGVGDKVTYNTNVTAYISAKITQSKWRLVTATGATPADITGSTVVSIAHAYASLSAAESGIPTPLGTSDLTSATGGNYVLNIPCYYDTGPDTTVVTIFGWTTSATNYIRVYTPTNTSTEVNQSQRHSGTWSKSKYQMQPTTGTVLAIQAAFVKVDGLQIQRSDGIALRISSIGVTPAEITISNNIMKSTNTVNYSRAIQVDSITNPATLKIYNNVIYGFLGTETPGLLVNASGVTAYIYNNTFVNNSYGIQDINAVAIIVKNNIFKDSGGNTDTYVGTFDAASTNNATDGTDTMTGAGGTNYASRTFKFVGEAQKDFHLISTDTGARGYGTNLSTDANLPFSTDIDGQGRGSVWDIGADQKLAPIKVKN